MCGLCAEADGKETGSDRAHSSDADSHDTWQISSGSHVCEDRSPSAEKEISGGEIL